MITFLRFCSQKCHQLLFISVFVSPVLLIMSHFSLMQQQWRQQRHLKSLSCSFVQFDSINSNQTFSLVTSGHGLHLPNYEMKRLHKETLMFDRDREQKLLLLRLSLNHQTEWRKSSFHRDEPQLHPATPDSVLTEAWSDSRCASSARVCWGGHTSEDAAPKVAGLMTSSESRCGFPPFSLKRAAELQFSKHTCWF